MRTLTINCRDTAELEWNRPNSMEVRCINGKRHVARKLDLRAACDLAPRRRTLGAIAANVAAWLNESV